MSHAWQNLATDKFDADFIERRRAALEVILWITLVEGGWGGEVRGRGGLHSLVRSASDCRSRGQKFESQLCHKTFMGTDCEIIFVVFHPLPLIQEGHPFD